MIIDVHNHPDWHGHDLGKFGANMDRHGIDTTWLLSWEAPADECDPAFATDFVLEFQDRLCYGRDYFDNQHQEFLNSLDFPPTVLDKIYAGNALGLVPLE